MTERKGKMKKRVKPNIPPEGDSWTSPVSFDARSMSTLIHDALDELGYKYKRSQADKMYSQLMVVMPIPKTAYVYRFELSKPIKVWIDVYDTKPNHAGILPYMDIQGLTYDKLPVLRTIFDKVIEKLPRPPWHFPLTIKLQHGLIIPEWRRAKKAWRKLGYEI